GVGYGRQTIDDPVDAALVDTAIDEPAEIVDQCTGAIDDAVDDVRVGPVHEPGERAHREPRDTHGEIVHVVLAPEQRIEDRDLEAVPFPLTVPVGSEDHPPRDDAGDGGDEADTGEEEVDGLGVVIAHRDDPYRQPLGEVADAGPGHTGDVQEPGEDRGYGEGDERDGHHRRRLVG